MRISVFFIGLVFFLGTSCLDDDNTPPTVEGLTLTTGEDYSLDATSDTVYLPGEIKIEASFSDNVMLLQFITTLETDLSIDFPLSTQTGLNQIDTFFIAGNTNFASRRLEISNEAASGNYTLNLVASDDIGNETPLGPYDIQIKNQLPFIGLNTPASDSIAISISENLVIDGVVTSPSQLSSVALLLRTDTTTESIGSFENISNSSFVLSIDHAPSNAGLHELIITATDTADNNIEFSSLVNFLE